MIKRIQIPLKQILLSCTTFPALQQQKVKTRRFIEEIRRVKVLFCRFLFSSDYPTNADRPKLYLTYLSKTHPIIVDCAAGRPILTFYPVALQPCVNYFRKPPQLRRNCSFHGNRKKKKTHIHFHTIYSTFYSKKLELNIRNAINKEEDDTENRRDYNKVNYLKQMM